MIPKQNTDGQKKTMKSGINRFIYNNNLKNRQKWNKRAVMCQWKRPYQIQKPSNKELKAIITTNMRKKKLNGCVSGLESSYRSQNILEAHKKA